ncbi:universal stress protein [Baekduia soli]|uniref:Universal stress protein n=1 Tax=Baekduia soli TaxID=496014 RepID=A0A5B8U7X6_9ACTN|nr:universal stress protein [Baekduia soli]QEC49057.1 universal stress protein [Baekduia soli]
MDDRDAPFRSILVAVDGSAHSELALRRAIRLAAADHARLTVMTVVPNVREGAASTWSVPVDPAALQEEADREGQRTLRAAVDQIPGDQPVRSVLRHGHAGPEILAEVAESGHDVIILGARGLGRIGSMAGSVSRHVLHHAKVAVFVAHAPPPAP